MKHHRCASVLRLVAAVIALAGLPVSAAHAQRPPFLDNTPTQSEIARTGFGDIANKYSWSMAWFKGKLYVGTGRENSCVEAATIDFYHALPFPFYSAHPAPDITCPPDIYDLQLRAEIWRWTPATNTWKRVYRSPQDLPNPREPGKFVARDIGFRGMMVYRGALYVGGLTANEYIPELSNVSAPRLLRSTDGRTFKPVAGVPKLIDSPWGMFHAVGFRAMTSYRGRMFVTLTTGAVGDGVVVEVHNPASASPTFTQITPPNMRVFELATYNGSLFIGAGDTATGYSVYRTDATGDPPTFTPIVTDGAGRGALMTTVVSMHRFKNRLYVGANGYAALLPQSEMIRINPDDSWDLVAGNQRFAADGSLKSPLSGLPDGFGNYFTSHLWRETVRGGTLYVGTLDSAWGLRVVPVLDSVARAEMGFDVYATCDGLYWWRVTKDGFGYGPNNIGARTMESTPAGGFIGSYNPVEGTTVWRLASPSPCATDGTSIRAATSRGASRRALQRPGRLLADVQQGGTVLSWDAIRGATRYRVARASYDVIRARTPRRPPGATGFVGDSVPDVASWVGRPITTEFPVADRFLTVGTTRRHVFVDRRAQRGRRYLYEVVAVRGSQHSPPSNTELVPSKRPVVTFTEADLALRRLGSGRAMALRRLLANARKRWSDADGKGAVRELARIARADEAAGVPLDRAAQRAANEDAANLVFELLRRLRYAGMANR